MGIEEDRKTDQAWSNKLAADDQHYKKIKDASDAEAYRNIQKSGCFIATWAYNDVDHCDVDFLRNFRDKKLLKTNIGIQFTKWYYRNGEFIAQRMDAIRFPRFIIRGAIKIIILAIKARNNNC